MKSFKKDGVYTLRYSNSAFILQGEGGDYADSIFENVADTALDYGIARNVITKNSRIITRPEMLDNQYSFDIPITAIDYSSSKRDGSVLALSNSASIYFYKLNKQTKTFIKQPKALVNDIYCQSVVMSEDCNYIGIIRSQSPYLKMYKINWFDGNIVSFTPLSFDIATTSMPNSYEKLSISADGKYVFVSYTNSIAPRFIVYKLVGDVYTKLPAPDIDVSGYVYSAKLSKYNGTIILAMDRSPYCVIYQLNADDTITKQSSPLNLWYYTRVAISDDGQEALLLHFDTNSYFTYIKKKNGVWTKVWTNYISNYLTNSITNWDFHNGILSVIASNVARCYFKIEENGGTVLAQLSGIANCSSILIFGEGNSKKVTALYTYNNNSSKEVGTDTNSRGIYNIGTRLWDLQNIITTASYSGYEYIGFALNNANIGENVDYVGVWGLYI